MLSNGASYRVTEDEETGARYVRVSDKPIARTDQFGLVNVDVDARGRVVGVEVL